MDHLVYLIRVQTGNGWSDYPSEYGGCMTSKSAALSLGEKLSREYFTVGVYECNAIKMHRNEARLPRKHPSVK
jgi:hypothetical protein